jgi:hypothetical protein
MEVLAMSRYALLMLLAAVLVAAVATAHAGLTADQVPTFRLRARVVSVGGGSPVGKEFTCRLGQASTTARGDAWSDWLVFDTSQAEVALKAYPNLYLGAFPVVTGLSVGGVQDPTTIIAEAVLDQTARTVTLAGELFGPTLGLLVWRDEQGTPQLATMAQYNQRYWQALAGVSVPEAQRPKQFPIVDRFIGGDDDRRDWREGITELAKAGFSAIMLPPSKPIRSLLLETGLRRTAWAVYNPPGYSHDYDPAVTPAAIAKWAEDQAKPYLEAGYGRRDMAVFAMSDEPGWYFPAYFKLLTDNPASLERFRRYLRAQGLKPGDIGAQGWDQVLPAGRNDAKSLPTRRRFYWTMRFFAWDSARHFAVSTRALEQAFYPNLPVLTNWNFFAGRLYVPGPVCNNSAKQDPNAAMGGDDWLEFGRLRGGTMLWTEDWFGDGQAYQWSFYCAKLRAAARKGKVSFGGYVIPRTAGAREDGILQKIMTVVGSGGKCIKYFVFGPEYVFPGNCYSENVAVIRKMAEAHRAIGANEAVLWPGRAPASPVAILAPRSAQMWDASGIPLPDQIQDATNTNLNGSTVDYMAEVFDLYLALQHANIPAEFVEEDDLTAVGLRPYRVLYLTTPNLPAEAAAGLGQWLRAGGTLVTVTGTAASDRYNEPSNALSTITRLPYPTRERVLVASTDALPVAGKGTGVCGAFTAVGPRETLRPVGAVEATFEDGTPAVVRKAVGKGRVVHFCWLPGLSYWKSRTGTQDGLPVGFGESLRRWIAYPVSLAGVKPPVTVDQPLVEAPLLVSKAGAAVTLLNWTGKRLPEAKITVRVPFKVKQAHAHYHGPVRLTQTTAGVTCTLPLGAVEVLTLRP